MGWLIAVLLLIIVLLVVALILANKGKLGASADGYITNAERRVINASITAMDRIEAKIPAIATAWAKAALAAQATAASPQMLVDTSPKQVIAPSQATGAGVAPLT